MDCNKEEALRAKGIAETKMQNDDFDGARKVALKAQQLFPELDNISQLLAVCDVHCSAKNTKFGSEKDWYGILQVQRLSDEATVKKAYRRLALVLHPDKNKLPGAEAAFKLIGEANMVLSDQSKKSLYDNKCKVTVRTTAAKAPPHQVNRSSYIAKQYGGQSNIPKAPQFSGLNHHQSTNSGLSSDRPAFWTCCPFCNMKYQYYRDHVNRSLRCQNCSKPFIAYDLGVQGVQPASNWGQPQVSQQAPNQREFKLGSQNGGIPFSHMRHEGIFSNRTMHSEPVFNTGNTFKGKDGHASTGPQKEGIAKPNFSAMKPEEFATSKNAGKKRRRKLVVESSESSDSSSSTSSEEDMVVDETSGNPAGLNGIHPTRRSSRTRQHVSYVENANDDDDFINPPKRSSIHNDKEERGDVNGDWMPKMETTGDFAAAVGGNEESKVKASDHPEGEVPNGIAVGHMNIGQETGVVGDNVEESIDDSDNSSPVPEFYECPDPEFNDFDKEKEEKCFSEDQLWACYDTLDGMPRFYAQINQVLTPEFKLGITWLEPYTGNKSEKDWLNSGLPISCGKFKLGEDAQDTADRPMFSHKIYYEECSNRKFPYIILPRNGEIWAVFKDWDIKWGSKKEKVAEYKFEIVEILSEFVGDEDISVGYLDKVKGFVSLFQRPVGKGFSSVSIPKEQRLRFSHRIPSFRMTGSEREGVPAGSFELDPASLPSYLTERNPPDDDSEMATGCSDAEGSGSSPNSPDGRGNP